MHIMLTFVKFRLPLQNVVSLCAARNLLARFMPASYMFMLPHLAITFRYHFLAFFHARFTVRNVQFQKIR